MIILTNVIETGVSADIYKDMNTRRACETIDFISRDQTAQSSLYILIVLAHFHVMTTLMPPCWHQSMKGRVYLQKKKEKTHIGCFQLKVKLVITPKTRGLTFRPWFLVDP